MATFDNTAADPNAAAATGFSNTGASTKTAAAAGFDDTEAEVETAAAAGFVNTGASSKAPSAIDFNNTAADPNTAASAGFNNTEAEVETAASAGFTNGPSAPKTVTDWSFDDTGAVANVVDGEVAPVDGQALPNPLVSVAHTTTLAAGTNYRVVVGSRAAPVTIPLPDPPADNQIIEVMDASMQAATHNITVDPGTKVIDGDGADWVMDLNGMVLRIVYVASLTQWKIH